MKSSVLLDEITVYGTRSPRTVFDVPALVYQVSINELGNSLSTDVKNLLEFATGVEIGGGPRRLNQRISIRGIDTDGIITLLDGRRQNFKSAHDGYIFINPYFLKSVEIVKGAVSPIYGGGAIGGVVAFNTKDVADLLDQGQNSGSSVSIATRSANSEFSSDYSIYGRSQNLDYLFSLSSLFSGDIETGGNVKYLSSDKVISSLIKLAYTFSNFSTLKFQTLISNQDLREPNNPSNSEIAALVDKKVRDTQFGLKYAFENLHSKWSPAFHLYYNTTGIEEAEIDGDNLDKAFSREIETWGFTIDNKTELKNRGARHLLSYGFEIYEDEQEGIDGRNPNLLRDGVPNGKALNYGFYVQDEIFVGENENLTLIPALRFDSYESEDDIGYSQDDDELSPKLSVSYKPTENVVLFGSYARAFRAPNLTELYARGRHFRGGFPIGFNPLTMMPILAPDNDFIPNPNLKPETVETFELGFGFKRQGLLRARDSFSIKGSVFTSKGSNFISDEIDISSGTTTTINSDAKIKGFEFESKYALNAFLLRAGLSYVHSKNTDTGNYLSNNMPLTFVGDFSYSRERYFGIWGLRFRASGENQRVGPRDLAKSGYGVWDLYYQKDFAKTFSLNLGIDNLFDKEYTKSSSTLLEEGRSFVFKLATKW